VSALTVREMTAGYRGAPAVHRISFSCEKGEVLSLLGPNGAGKSTTLLAIAGALRLMHGEVEIDEPSSRKRVIHRIARQGLVLVPGGRGLFPGMSVNEHLRLAERSPVRSRPDAGTRLSVDDVLGNFPQLLALRKRKVALLSGGEQQMLAIAKSLILAPSILMIDELSMGLAPQLVQSLLPTISGLARANNTTLLLVEQHYELALAVSDNAIVMNHGRIVLTAPAADLLADPSRIEAAYFDEGALTA
jgi:branched-chain amino acid transport system ATP-binding protein